MAELTSAPCGRVSGNGGREQPQRRMGPRLASQSAINAACDRRSDAEDPARMIGTASRHAAFRTRPRPPRRTTHLPSG
jgi:hypothetical protein